MPENFLDVESCVSSAIERVGKHIVLAAPLGLGKPNQLINAFYRRVAKDPELSLEILTALSLEKPSSGNELEAKFLAPFVERQFGDYEEMDYVKAIRKNNLPDNIRVFEFYFKAGSMKNIESAQCNYISTNYTFAARDLLERGANVMVQLVSEQELDGEKRLSLSCNTDVTLDLLPALRSRHQDKKPVIAIAQVHENLPFMLNKALVEDDCFDMVIRNPDYNTRLFATPNLSVSTTEAMLGFHASTLIKDGGTLQIGIGALGDAIVDAVILRHTENSKYREICRQARCSTDLITRVGGEDSFTQGLYGCSEMFVNGFVHLMQNDILKRRVYDDIDLQHLIDQGLIADTISNSTLQTLIDADVVNEQLDEDDVRYLTHWGILDASASFRDACLHIDGLTISADMRSKENYQKVCEHALGDQLKHGIVMHGGFFLGPNDFYEALRKMPRQTLEQIAMDSVRQINRLGDVPLHSLQRRHARFINTGMMVTLSGAVVSDGLENGQVISGVGGQYNFVAQAHELPDARSILCVRSTRGSGKNVQSNIVPHYGHITIPRHLRDIVVTEYGVADLRAKTDSEIIKALLNITDTRFQYELLGHAIASGKIESDYAIPVEHCNNTPQRINDLITDWRQQGCFASFPLGSDFTEEEIALGSSLRDIKALLDDPKSMLKALIRSFTHNVDEHEAEHYLERIGLAHPDTPKDVILQHLLLLELEEHGYLRPL